MNCSYYEGQRGAPSCAYVLILAALSTLFLLASAKPAHSQGISTGARGWTWQNPLPQGNHLNHVWGTDANNVWAVGNYGTILKWNGSTWSVQASGTVHALYGIWGTDANNVWAVGEQGTILKWDGSDWSDQASGTPGDLAGIWGSDANNVWAVGTGGTILKWNGVSWTTQYASPYPLYGIWGSDANNVWVVGYRGRILKWNGSTWNDQTSGTGEDLRSVWGTDANNVWAVGGYHDFTSYETILKWDGISWNSQTADSTMLMDVWGSDSSNVWAVGRYGEILKQAGGYWTSETSGTSEQLRGVWGSDSSNVWAVGENGTILKWDGIAWNAQRIGTVQNLNDVWGTDANNVWVVGDGESILKWDGSAWNAQTSGTAANFNLYDVWGSGPNSIWAVGGECDSMLGCWSGAIMQWNGSTWSTQYTSEKALYGIWGSDANNVWAVGNQGTILKWNGSVWSAQASGIGESLRAVWGSSANNVWAVGTGGTILKWNGSAWNFQASGTDADFYLYDVWGSGPSSIWAVGSECNSIWNCLSGAIMHWNGFYWTTQYTSSDPLYGIWGADANNVWAVGGIDYYTSDKTLLKWDGNAWIAQAAVTGNKLLGVWGVDRNNVWVVGSSGTILQRTTYRLSVGKSGSGAGQIVSAPSGIVCGSDCIENFAESTAVTLSATASTGSNFTGWAGACTGSGPCQVTMDAAKAVTATFTLNEYPLAVSKGGSGAGTVVSAPSGIDCGAACTQDYSHGTAVILSATASAGSRFAGWTGACTGSGPCQVTMDAAKTVTATFTTSSYPPIQTNGPTEVGQLIEFVASLALSSLDECTWDFGDGSTQPCTTMHTAVSPASLDNLEVGATHTYAQAGSFLVTVTASNPAGQMRIELQVDIRATEGNLFLPQITR